MFRSFQYPLRPTVRQAQALERALSVNREVYNAALEERREAWARSKVTIRRFDQFAQVADLRETRPDVVAFGVTVLRGTLTRLDRAFQAFFRRLQLGQRPGYPRFRARGRFDTLSWEDTTGWALRDRRLYVQGVGEIKVRLHRPLRGTPKTLHVARKGAKWYATIQCAEVPAQPLPDTGKAVGIDLGVSELVTTSSGETFENRRAQACLTGRLCARQRLVAGRNKGSRRRRKAVEALATLHRKIHNVRKDHAHKVSRRLVDDHDAICHEGLKVAHMTRRPAPKPDGDGGYLPNGASAKTGLNRSILDAGWAMLLRFLAYSQSAPVAT